MATVALHRNRDFMLLQGGQLLSETGTQLATFTYPLLVLAITDSPALAGVVAFARTLTLAVCALPAGVAADRWNRKLLMILADAARVLAAGGLAALILLDRVVFWPIPLIAAVEGGATALFLAAQAGALRAVVPVPQLLPAAAVQTGRGAAVRLVGPPLGGVLFGVGRAVPFLVDALSYLFSTVSLLAMRTPFQQDREPDRSSWRSRFVEGFQFLWRRPFLRVTTLLFGLANFIGPGLMFTVIVVGTRQGLSGGEVGALVAVFAACVLLGSLMSSLVCRLLPVRAVLVLELWTWTGCAAFLVWPSVYVLVAFILPTALVIPSTNSVVHGYRIAMTPDRLLGRSESVRYTIALLISPLGPLIAGILLDAASPRVPVAVFAVAGLVLAIWGTLSPAVRAAPSPDELDALYGGTPNQPNTQPAGGKVPADS